VHGILNLTGYRIPATGIVHGILLVVTRISFKQ